MKPQHSQTAAPPKATATRATARAAKPAKAVAAGNRSGAGSRRQARTDGEDFFARVRTLAYSYYEARGGIEGHETEDWLRAEAEVRREIVDTDEATGAASH